jgi:hypothetical protein
MKVFAVVKETKDPNDPFAPVAHFGRLAAGLETDDAGSILIPLVKLVNEAKDVNDVVQISPGLGALVVALSGKERPKTRPDAKEAAQAAAKMLQYIKDRTRNDALVSSSFRVWRP